jgi:hypothetical protein
MRGKMPVIIGFFVPNGGRDVSPPEPKVTGSTPVGDTEAAKTYGEPENRGQEILQETPAMSPGFLFLAPAGGI